MANVQLYLAVRDTIHRQRCLDRLLMAYITSRFESIDRRFDAIDRRFDDMRELWRAELHRVEEVLDARLKHLETR